ncbi:sulfotransferase family 2 domain-containing protein [Synechococcus sp. MEDNS5]|uniref:sulfotransferase family 2 domain-containing protein n=1 Tax=Synechococcus sp. MEDNS5 TaxID=1442554 RepID=UPI001647A8E6|nr:sulfotransferase family 2 domain-containing protein [Synechococcus sp. MEDNS5]
MGHIYSHQHRCAIYDAPKAGGTTLRTWLIMCLTSSDPNKNLLAGNYIKGDHEFRKIVDEIGYKHSYFVNYPSAIHKACIIREPIRRFKSCFVDKLIREDRWKHIRQMKACDDVPGFINFLESYQFKFKNNIKRILPYNNDLQRSYIFYHFCPQVRHFGYDPQYFTNYFFTDEMSSKLKPFLETTFDATLENIHTRKSSLQNFLWISDNAICKLKKMYSDDYKFIKSLTR